MKINALEDAKVRWVRHDPGWAAPGLALLHQAESVCVRVEDIGGNECREPACKNRKVNHSEMKERKWRGDQALGRYKKARTIETGKEQAQLGDLGDAHLARPYVYPCLRNEPRTKTSRERGEGRCGVAWRPTPLAHSRVAAPLMKRKHATNGVEGGLHAQAHDGAVSRGGGRRFVRLSPRARWCELRTVHPIRELEEKNGGTRCTRGAGSCREGGDAAREGRVVLRSVERRAGGRWNSVDPVPLVSPSRVEQYMRTSVRAPVPRHRKRSLSHHPRPPDPGSRSPPRPSTMRFVRVLLPSCSSYAAPYPTRNVDGDDLTLTLRGGEGA
jgi:hypothetical protein